MSAVPESAATVTGSAVDEERPHPSGPDRAPERIAVLDLLRFLAALSVVSIHWLLGGAVRLGWREGMHDHTGGVPVPVLHLVAYGWLGVEMFFLISGFVICMSSWGNSVGGFARSRLARLMPAYWFSVAVFVTMSKLDPQILPRPRGGRGSDGLMNLTMLQAGYGVPGLSGAYWTLWVELWFYIIFSAVVMLGLTYRRVLAFCAVWTVAALAASASGEPLLTTITQPASAPYFIAGICFYLMRRYGRNLLLWAFIALSFFIGQHEVADEGSRAIWGAGLRYSWAPATGLLALAFAVMALVALGRLDFVRWRGLTTFGALTYPLYLLHTQLGFAFFVPMDRRIGHGVACLLALPVVLLVCWLVHRWVERPASRWIKREFNAAFESIRAAGRDEQDRARSAVPAARDAT
jgi:peptidoglycan/LPS O-acetylase OafA/YrhL